MLIFKHTTVSLSGAQGEERWRSADGTVGLPTGAPARHPPMHRIAAAPAPTAPAPPLRVRVACLCARPLRSRASAHSPGAACVAHGRFTSHHVVYTGARGGTSNEVSGLRQSEVVVLSSQYRPLE